MQQVRQLGERVRQASRQYASASTGRKNKLLARVAELLEENIDLILEANSQDLTAAKQNGMSQSLLDRLKLDENRIRKIADSVREIVLLEDPVGKVEFGTVRPNGLKVYRTRVPLGVVGMIYEARPNVTIDAAALCLKAGNTCLLRGGKEAIHSNRILATLIRRALSECDFPEDCVALVEDTSRQSAQEMMQLKGVLDVLIPRGGKGLISSVVENSSVPVIETGAGNCHVYVDEDADLQMACDIIVNAKASRPSVCNAAETLLVHEKIAPSFLPMAYEALKQAGVALRVCEKSRALLGQIGAELPLATEEDYFTEYNDYILAVKVVSSLEEAMDHIARYSTGHSEAIVTNNYQNSQRFTSQVDSAAVYVNASTRFTDGGEFGFGAEIGISTQKLHARGPLGLTELTSCKYVCYGDGQVR